MNVYKKRNVLIIEKDNKDKYIIDMNEITHIDFIDSRAYIYLQKSSIDPIQITIELFDRLQNIYLQYTEERHKELSFENIPLA